jgi:peptidoglycan glycosyltransferase
MLDPRTGEILALMSTPYYDASAIANPATSRATWAALTADPARPLLPRATQGRYVPGSVFKIVTSIGGLGSGAFGPDTIFPEQEAGERDGLVVSGFRIREHAGVPVRPYDLAGAMEVSSNIYFALAALSTGGEGLEDWSGRLGFGAALPFDLPTAVSQVTNGGGDFGGGFKDAVELANAGYGQAETFVTPLQMALVAATVANDGVLMRPRLVSSFSGAQSGVREVAPETLRRVLDPDVARAIQLAMQQAVEGELGRQFTSGAAIDGIATAGKSGTAELGGTGEPHSWFIGFAPVDDPEVAIAVLVERGGRGGERAAPLAGALMRAYLVDGLGR